jgi:hypothetical protein
VGAVLSVLGCVAGDVLTVATVTSRAKAVPLAEMLHFFATSPRATAQVLILTFEPADLLFYGIAAWAGYWFAFGGTAEARIERARRPSLPQSAVTAGSPMPSFYRILQKDAAAGTFFALALTPWVCWLLAWMGIGWSQASPPTIQRWFLIAALAISAVCLPLLLRRMLVIRGIFAYPAEVDGQVVQIPPRSGWWKTLVIEYGYRSERYRIGYTVSNASHPDQRLQVGDSVRLLVNDRKPRHAIPLSMFGWHPAHPVLDRVRAAVARKEGPSKTAARTNPLAVVSLVLALFAPVSCLFGFIFPDSFSAPPGHHSPLLGPSAGVFYLVGAADCLVIPMALLAGALSLTQMSGSGGGQKGRLLAWSAIGLTVTLLACWAVSVVLPMILLPLLAALGQAP